MIRLVQRPLLVLFFLAIAATAASAQQSEVSAFVGLTPSVALDHPAAELTEANVRGGITWGLRGARFFTPRLGVEIVFAEQDSALEVATSAGAADLFSVLVAQLYGNVVYQFGSSTSRLRPFVFGGGGTTILSAHDTDASVKPSFGLGGGLKYFPWATVGLRGEVRYKPTRLNDDQAGTLCEPLGFCQGWLQPVEFTLGAIIRF